MVDGSNGFSADNETDEQREARHQLQLLTASDPATVAAMTRHIAAAGLLVTGVRAGERMPQEANFAGGFILSRGERDILMAATARLGIAQVFIAFDVDDAGAGPRAMGVFRVEGEEVAMYPRCGIWAPANDGRAVIVPFGKGAPRCHFVARRGRPLARVEGWPARDLEAGLRRGQRRLVALARSPELRNAHVGAFRNVIKTVAGGFEVDMERIAA